MAMQQPPLAIPQAEDVRDAVRPLRRLLHALHAHLERLDISGVGELRRGDRRHIAIADRAALELAASPVPPLVDRVPPLLVATPSVEAGGDGFWRVLLLTPAVSSPLSRETPARQRWGILTKGLEFRLGQTLLERFVKEQLHLAGGFAGQSGLLLAELALLFAELTLLLSQGTHLLA